VALLGWSVIGLIAIDVGVNVFFSLPPDPRVKPNRVQRYFDNGRSTEGKVRYLLGESEDAAHPILARGWLAPERLESEPARAGSGERRLIAVYGMSHARRLARAVSRVADDVAVRDVTAPAATPNWSYGAYRMDRPAHEADAAVLGILAYNVSKLSTTTAMTAYFDMAFPYGQPRYRVEQGRLQETLPFFRSADDFRAAFFDPDRWDQFRESLLQHDRYYDPFLFRESFLDRSAVVRALRRSYAGRLRQRLAATVYHPQTGFDASSEEIRVLREMVSEFARTARRDGVLPVVFVVNSLGFGDALYRSLLPVLTQLDVPTLSSHDFVSPNDPHGYRSDSHFHDATDDAMARALLELVERNLRIRPETAATP
jgi:hypothetical protein